MKLSELVQNLFFLPPEWDREFNDIASDSRDLNPGDVFLALPGLHAHGEEFIQKAIAAGAVAILAAGEQNFRCEHNEKGQSVPVFYAPEIATQWRELLLRRYPLDMTLFAVTGTNGKSSVTQYIAQLYELCGTACAVLGTLGNGRVQDLKPTRNTTPDFTVIVRELHHLHTEKVNHAALEVSSHGLQQERVKGLKFKAAIFTNLSQDHLDYHHSMADYFAAKKRLFSEYEVPLALINIDDEYGQALAEELAEKTKVITYGTQVEAQVRFQLLALDARGMHAELRTPWGVGQLTLPLIGEFNLANASAAIALLAAQGLDFSLLCEKARQLKPVAGRMELYVKDCAPMAVVDFAHTPAALTNVLNALKPWQRPITTVFGCGGDRDRSKRPLMLEAVLALSDSLIVTDDNPRTEDPEQIFADIVQNRTGISCVHDRRTAIMQALAEAPVGGILLIAGKGHENYQDIQGVKYPYNDAQVLFDLGYRALEVCCD